MHIRQADGSCIGWCLPLACIVACRVPFLAEYYPFHQFVRSRDDTITYEAEQYKVFSYLMIWFERRLQLSGTLVHYKNKMLPRDETHQTFPTDETDATTGCCTTARLTSQCPIPTTIRLTTDGVGGGNVLPSPARITYAAISSWATFFSGLRRINAITSMHRWTRRKLDGQEEKVLCNGARQILYSTPFVFLNKFCTVHLCFSGLKYVPGINNILSSGTSKDVAQCSPALLFVIYTYRTLHTNYKYMHPIWQEEYPVLKEKKLLILRSRTPFSAN